MRILLLGLAGPILLAACASATDAADKPKGAAKYAEDPRLGEEVDRICFASSIDSFGNNTSDTFTVREGGDYYLIEIFGSCYNLQHAQRIGMDTTGSCLRHGDYVIVSDSLSGRDSSSTQRCLVDSIYKWDPKAEKESEEEAEKDES